jgi:hypothetical protein
VAEIVRPPKWRKPKEGETLPYNTWNQVRPGVYVGWNAYESRGAGGAYWFVQHTEHQTDPKAPWYYHGRKTFTPFGVSKEEAMELALAWASLRYGIKRWQRNRMGDFVDADAGYLPLRPRG